MVVSRSTRDPLRWREYCVASAAALLCASCTAEVTQLIVAVDSDLPPESIMQVSIETLEDYVTVPIGPPGGDGEQMQIPFSFVVRPLGGDASSEARFTVSGHTTDGRVVVHSVTTGFIQGQSRLVRVFLGESCLGVECNDGELTCEGGACMSDYVDPSTLPSVRPGEELTRTERDGGMDPAGPDAGNPLQALCEAECPTEMCADGVCMFLGGFPGQVMCPDEVPCTVHCPDGECELAVQCGAAPCDVTCTGRSCEGGIDCGESSDCRVSCEADSRCGRVVCGEGPCQVVCDGPDACRGQVECSNACSCDVRCSGADCPEVACPPGCDAPVCDVTGEGCNTCGNF